MAKKRENNNCLEKTIDELKIPEGYVSPRQRMIIEVKLRRDALLRLQKTQAV